MDSDTSPTMRLMRELRRRRVFRTAALYIVGTWLVLQVADVVFPALDISERAIRYLLIGAMLGFPAVLVFGWFYDIGVHGIRRSPTAGLEDLNESQPLRRIDYLLLAALGAVIAAILYNVAGKVVEEPTQVRAVIRDGPPMVAVLPFTTASKEGDNEFFATGIHDDLLTQLAQLQSIRVISRTSVMEYKDTVHNIRAIGQALGADAILEGGIQSSGDRIRINAQLIDSRTDEHLWAQTFDRELTASSIFDVQTEIAREITAAMDATLTEQDASSLDIIPTKNMAAYRAYRHAMDMVENQSVYLNEEYRAALEEAVSLDSEFTRAWAELGGHLSYINFWGEPNLEEIKRAEEILEILRRLAPDSVDHLIAQAYYSYYTIKDFDQALAVIEKAEEKAPSDLKILEMKTWIMRRQGNHEGRPDIFRKILLLDPKNEKVAYAIVGSLITLHLYDEASLELEKTQMDDSTSSSLKNFIQMREHRDFERYIKGQVEHQIEYKSDWDIWDQWELKAWERDFEGARNLLEDVQELDSFKHLPGFGPLRSNRVITYWFLKEEDMLKEAVKEAKDHFTQTRTRELSSDTPSLFIDLALMAIMDGRSEEAPLLIRQWRRSAAAIDATELVAGWTHACGTLGLAGAITDAVGCIRDGMAEPSSIHEFIDPYLPWYDAIRDEPEFVELLAELESTATSAAP